VKIDPNYALGYAALGDSYSVGFQQYVRDNDWIDKARRSCEKSLSLNPDLVEGHICLGNVYDATGKYDKAAQEFQRAVQSEPGNENAVRGLADAYTNLGNFAGAESAYKQAVALRPNYWRVYSWLGNFYFGQNRYDEAAQAFLKATQLAPNSYLGYSDLGAIYLAMGRYSEALDALNRSNALHPTSDAYLNLGYVYTLMHRYPDAIAALEQALKIDDRDWMIWGNLADALYWSSSRRGEAAGKYDKAISIARSKLQVNPDDTQALGYLADYSAMTGDKQAALGYLERALKLAPTNGDVLFRAAIVYNHFNEPDQALAYLNKAAQVGYSRSFIRDTPDFTNLRQNPHFPTIAQR
jgi:tetratricopeptide (TPR) repeat protein